ncbi:MAG TPA: hypothetical protein VF060_01715 [Trebonia sp.]
MNKPNGARVFAAAITASIIVCAAAACGGSPATSAKSRPGAGRTAHGKGGTGLPAASPRQPSTAVDVLGDAAPDAVTADLARTLLTSAPVVVVARPSAARSSAKGSAKPSPGDPPAATGQQTAAAAARAAHAPLLLASSVTAGLTATIEGLRPRAVLAIGLPAQDLAARLRGIQVTSLASRLPAAAAPATPGRVAILTDNSNNGNDGVVSAIAATAAAAGATVVNVDGDDPRADPGAIGALARLHPLNVVAIGGEFGPSVRLENRLAVAETGRQLPGGGQVMFPGHRLVALYGHPGTPSLGALGQQDLAVSVARVRQLARAYRPLSGGVPVVPAFEIIATVAEGSPGPNGDYSYETPVSQIMPWVRQAADDGMYVVLDLQPGRASLLDQAKHYESLLREPNVGLALDAEWKLQPGQVPLQQIGHVDVGEVNGVVSWLAALTARYHLPQKLLVLHQFRSSMIVGESRLDTGNDDLAVVLHMDGQGSPGEKQSTWDSVVGGAPRGVFFGWKNFFVKDTPMLSSRATMERDPVPVMISYQ